MSFIICEECNKIIVEDADSCKDIKWIQCPYCGSTQLNTDYPGV